MDLNQELERVAGLIEWRLDELLSSEPAPSGQERLIEAMRYAALGGGKRLRPFLLIESARLFGVAEVDALDAGAALECVHCYSLVHDDLPAMDDDAVRRGRPTVHVAFGEATAILAGDALQTLAFDILSRPSTHGDPSVRVELIGLLAVAAGVQGMAGGQALDLAAEGETLGPMEVAKMQAMKTGALFSFACEAGAVLGRADDLARGALKAYAAAFGQAFQLADDLLDAEGDEEAVGKAVAKDAGRGKATLVALLGVEPARARLKALVGDAEATLAPFGDKGGTLKDAARFIASRRA
ncbi:polyprenyl synthetase family protein [Methyloceanibacter sp.]|uniref:polyprenyl synthetase family protein n=1 Tax=Methyloceanibacter sp. TaxID=1965321 RepID=UPI00351B164A